jgi:hypothetical protein
MVHFGTLTLTTEAEGYEEQQRQITFDSIPRVDRIEASVERPSTKACPGIGAAAFDSSTI